MCVQGVCMYAKRGYSVTCRHRDSKRASAASADGNGTTTGALYWSTTCIVLAKIGLWLSISITRTDWLRSRAAYSPGVHTYIGGTESRIPRGQGDSPDPTWKVLLFYDNVLHCSLSFAEAKWRQKNVSKSLL